MGVVKTEGLVSMKEHVIAGDISRYLNMLPRFSVNISTIGVLTAIATSDGPFFARKRRPTRGTAGFNALSEARRRAARAAV